MDKNLPTMQIGTIAIRRKYFRENLIGHEGETKTTGYSINNPKEEGSSKCFPMRF